MGHAGHECPLAEQDFYFTDAPSIPCDGSSAVEEDPSNLADRPQPTNYSQRETIMTIIHTTGIHQLCVSWCRCPHANRRDIQLLRMGLYPLSYENPKTAFTFLALDDFLIENLECKTSASNYYSKLRRITLSTNPQSVSVSAPNYFHFFKYLPVG